MAKLVSLTFSEIFLNEWDIFGKNNRQLNSQLFNTEDTYILIGGRYNTQYDIPELLKNPDIKTLFYKKNIWNCDSRHVGFDQHPALSVLIFEYHPKE
jgi:hypothetical protein